VDDKELAALLSEAQKGDKPALGALLDGLRPWVRQRADELLGQRLGARLDCSDVTQEVHIRVWECFEQFRGNSVPQLMAWVEQILRTIVTDCRRRHGAGKRDAGREMGGEPFRGLPGDGTTPSQGAVRNEQQVRLAEAMQQLPEKQRLVLRLRLYEGLPFEEVARRVGVSVVNARVLMVRATEKLRSELGDEP
jgi:RNA polymerase sigma-70 factor (ECF subfamily)